MTRSIVVAIAVTAAIRWLFRPRPRRGRQAGGFAEPRPTYRAVRTFRTPGGVATTV